MARSCVHDYLYVDALVLKNTGHFLFLEGGGGGGGGGRRISLRELRIRLDYVGVGGSTADKSGVPEVDSCAAQMSLHSYNLSDQIINQPTWTPA